MRRDVRRQCRSCLPCLARNGSGHRIRPPLQPLPVGGPFERLAVDVLTMPQTRQGNRYIILFVDYLTKWPEAFASPDHRAESIAKFLVERVVCQHGVSSELLSDRGADFLSELIQELSKMLSMKKIPALIILKRMDW